MQQKYLKAESFQFNASFSSIRCAFPEATVLVANLGGLIGQAYE